MLASAALSLPVAVAQAEYRVEPTGSMLVSRLGAVAAALPGGRVLIAGGLTGLDSSETDEPALASAEIYDPSTGGFTPTGSLLQPRDDAAAAPLPGGRVLVVGGADDTGPALATAEIYDPATGEFSATGEMAVPRDQPFAAPLSDGRVLVGGGGENGYRPGDAGHGIRDSAEIYDPRTGRFSPTGSLPAERTAAAAAPLRDGRVLVAGGSDGEEALDGNLIYDPPTAGFSYTGSLTAHQLGEAAVPLEDGAVLFFGWSDGLHAEDFDPLSESFADVAVDLPQRAGMAVATLPDNKILLAGGSDGRAPLGVSRAAEVLAVPTAPAGETEPHRGDRRLIVRRGPSPRIVPRAGAVRANRAGRAVLAYVVCPLHAWGACRLNAAKAAIRGARHSELTLLAPRRIERGRQARIVVGLPAKLVERSQGGSGLPISLDLRATAADGARSRLAFTRSLIP